MKTEEEIQQELHQLEEEAMGGGEASDEAVVEDEPQPPKKVLRVQLRDTGRVYTGETTDEILAKIVEDSGRPRDVEEARGKIQHQQRTDAVSTGFDGQKYLDMLAEDPLEANRYALRHVLGVAEDEDPAAMFRYTYAFVDRAADAIEVTQFLRDNPDVNISDADALTLFKTMDAEGLPVTARNIKSVYRDLVDAGRIRPNEAPAEGVEYEDVTIEQLRGAPRTGLVQQPSRGKNAPRAGAGTAAGVGGKTGMAKDPESMTREELAAYLRERGLMHH